MKPSERRALEAEKRAQKEAEQREKLLEAKSKRQERDQASRTRSSAQSFDEEKLNANSDYKKLPEEEIEIQGDGYHREGFFGRNVKLITFIICMAVFLTVLGPWGVDMLIERSREDVFGDQVVDKIDLSVDGVRMLADLGTDLTWDDLSNLNYIDLSFKKDGKTTCIREYEIKGTMLVLRVGGTSFSGSPQYVRLIDYKSGDYIEDIRKESVSSFLAEHAGS